VTLARVNSVLAGSGLIFLQGTPNYDSLSSTSLYSYPTLAAYQPDGTKAWEVLGWESTPPSGAYSYRDFFSPVLLSDDKLLSVTRRVTFLTTDVGFVNVNSASQDFHDETLVEEPYYGTQITLSFGDPDQKRGRFVVGIEERFEIFEVTSGARLVSVPFSEHKITSMFHTFGPAIGTFPPPFWSFLLDENLVWPYDGPTYLDLYGPTGWDESYDADPRDGAKWYGEPSATSPHFVTDTGVVGLISPPANVPRSAYLYEAVAHETSVDPPSPINRFTPVLSSNRSLVIFPPTGTINPVRTNAKRDWNASGSTDWYSWSGGTHANGWRSNVTLTGAEYLTNERRLWEARNWQGDVAWRHFLEFSSIGVSTITSESFARPCCGAGRMVIAYQVNGTRRLRVVNDMTGELIEDVTMTVDPASWISPNTFRSVILCGGVTIVIANGGIFGIYPA
jgi:hypothetical protein